MRRATIVTAFALLTAAGANAEPPRGGSTDAYVDAGIPYVLIAPGFDPIPAGSQISSNDWSALNGLLPTKRQYRTRIAF